MNVKETKAVKKDYFLIETSIFSNLELIEFEKIEG
ncbi:MAG: hypothetical protein ACJAX7_001218 [Saprospiraceae bacterium]|jgi:hypothetical protein